MQTHSALEVIVVIDGSTDNTKTISEKYSQDQRFKIYERPHTGVASARNFGLSVANGDFVFFLDSDDRLMSNCLEKLVGRILETDAQISYGDYVLDREGFGLRETIDRVNPEGNILLDYLRRRVNIVTGCALFRRDFLYSNALKFTDGVTCQEDTEFKIKTFTLGKTASVDEILVRITVGDQSSSRIFDTRKFDEIVHVFERSKQFVDKNVGNETLKNECIKAIDEYRLPMAIAEQIYIASARKRSREARLYLKESGYDSLLVRFRPSNSLELINYFRLILAGYFPWMLHFSRAYDVMRKSQSPIV